MSKCYFEDSVSAHTHVGPFERCARCGKTICPQCVGRHTSSREVWCFRCATISLDDARLTEYPYRPPTVVFRTAPRIIPLHRSTHGIVSALKRLGHSGRWLLGSLLAPFRRDEQLDSVNNASYYGLDISFATLGDKIWFGVMLAMVILVAVLGAVVYADLNAIPFRRVLLVIALTCASWAVVSIYLRALFDRPLGRTMSQIISYIIASFIAFLIGGSLIDLSWFDRILGVG